MIYKVLDSVSRIIQSLEQVDFVIQIIVFYKKRVKRK
nr:MAG TPA: hypothetical protein [Caudoviricetes sp.]